MILLTGSTRCAGAEVARRLPIAGEATRAVTRRPEKARSKPDVEYVRGDFNDSSMMRARRIAKSLFEPG
jgi:nucleoside-diphosphate-sugar epimerase